MTVAKPIAGENALESVAFVIQFGSEFSQQDVEALASLKDRFATDLPNYQKIQTIALSMVGGVSIQQPKQREAGVLLQHFRGDGRADWLLRVAGNQIVVQCNTYTKWTEVWSKARVYMKAAAQSIRSEANTVLGVAVQFVDKFVYEPAPSDYSIEDVFNKESPYLTKQAGNSGSQWHVFQGWFDESALPSLKREGRLLNALNLSSAMQPDGSLHAIVDHTAQTNFDQHRSPALFKDDSALDDYFTLFHSQNRYIIEHTLADQQLRAIRILK